MDHPIDESADLEPHQLASLNPAAGAPAAAATPAPAQPQASAAPAPLQAAGTTIPIAPHPTANRYPWPAVNNPTVAAAAAPPAPELPPAKPPAPAPEEEPAPTGPVAIAPIVTYDADLDKHMTVQVDTPAAPVPAPPEPAPPSDEPVQPQPESVTPAAPPPPQKNPHATDHSPSKAVRPVKVFSHSTRHVWQAQRFQKQYKYIVLVVVIAILVLVGAVWIAIGSPTSLEDFTHVFENSTE